MKCYYHLDKDAVGICKNCGKGLCKDCAVDTGSSLACESCEAAIRQINDFVAKTQNAYKNSNQNNILNSLTVFLIGLAMIIVGVVKSFIAFIMIPFGVIFVIRAVASYIIGKKQFSSKG